MSEELDYRFSRVNDNISSMKNELRIIAGTLEVGLQNVNSNIHGLRGEVSEVQDDINAVQDDLTSFKERFEDFVSDLEKKNNITHAQGQIIILNQEIENNLDYTKKLENIYLEFCNQ